MDQKLICFDLDGLYFTEEGFQKFKAAIAPSVDKAKRDQVLALSDEIMQFKAGKMTEAAYRERAKKELGLTCDNKEIYKQFGLCYEENPQVKELAMRLKNNGYMIGICSNNFPTRIRELDKKFNFLKDFDVVVISYEVGVTKPNPEIFQILIDKSGCHPHDIIYSDDKEEKLQGAKSLGIQTFVFHTFEEFVEDLEKCGVKTQ